MFENDQRSKSIKLLKLMYSFVVDWAALAQQWIQMKDTGEVTPGAVMSRPPAPQVPFPPQNFQMPPGRMMHPPPNFSQPPPPLRAFDGDDIEDRSRPPDTEDVIGEAPMEVEPLDPEECPTGSQIKS